MTVIQIFICLFALFAITRTVRQFRQGTLTIAWFIVWVLFWGLVAGAGISPQSTDVFAKWVGVGRGADFVTYLSLIALFYLAFRLFIKIEDVEREITRLVRTLALGEKGREDREDQEDREVSNV